MKSSTAASQGSVPADCKSGVATQVFAAHALARSMLPLRGNIVVAATVAEENGCSVGVRHLFRHTLPRIGMTPRFVVLGEPTGLKVGYGHDGWAKFDIDIMGVDEQSVRRTAQQIFDTSRYSATFPVSRRRRSIFAAEPPELTVAVMSASLIGSRSCGDCLPERPRRNPRRLNEEVVNGRRSGRRCRRRRPPARGAATPVYGWQRPREGDDTALVHRSHDTRLSTTHARRSSLPVSSGRPSCGHSIAWEWARPEASSPVRSAFPPSVSGPAKKPRLTPATSR